MGFDITFHPVSRDDLQRFVFDVFNEPSLAESRATELSADPNAQSQILELYGQFPQWAADGEAPFEATFAVACAAVAGWRHPYWYARGQALSFLATEEEAIGALLTPLPTIAQGVSASWRTPAAVS
jgi:hypothetical protein